MALASYVLGGKYPMWDVSEGFLNSFVLSGEIAFPVVSLNCLDLGMRLRCFKSDTPVALVEKKNGSELAAHPQSL